MSLYYRSLRSNCSNHGNLHGGIFCQYISRRKTKAVRCRLTFAVTYPHHKMLANFGGFLLMTWAELTSAGMQSCWTIVLHRPCEIYARWDIHYQGDNFTNKCTLVYLGTGGLVLDILKPLVFPAWKSSCLERSIHNHCEHKTSGWIHISVSRSCDETKRPRWKGDVQQQNANCLPSLKAGDTESTKNTVFTHWYFPYFTHSCSFS